MASPVISVVMPVRNAGSTLEETLKSIEAQSFEDFEVIIVDDFSDDDTGDLSRSYMARDSRFKWIEGQQRGLVPALNQGLALARGIFVARMDGDDIMLPERLEKQQRLLREGPELGVVSCGVESFGEGELGEGFRLYDSWLNGLVSHRAMFNARFIESPIAHPSVMALRTVLQEVGGYRDMGWPEDYDLWLRLFERGVRFEKVPEVLLRWRDQPHRTSRTNAEYRPDAFLRCKVAHLISGPLKGHRQIAIWGAGHWGGRLGKYLMSEGFEVQFFVDIAPKKIGGKRHGVQIVGSEDLKPDPKCPLLISVGRRGARALIESFLNERSFIYGQDYFALA